MNQNWSIRPATVADSEVIFGLIGELAEFEHLEHEFKMELSTLQLWLSTGEVGCLLAESGGEGVGFALYYFTYSTFRGRRGIFLEDLFVRPACRKLGIGSAFFKELADLALDIDCFRLDWLVLNWNHGGIQFYQSLGGAPVDDWTLYRLKEPALAKLIDQ